MTSPRGAYGGGYYTSPAFKDTPIYDSLVAERGTPQIAPIRVPGIYDSSSQLPALPPPPSAAAHTPPHGTQGGYMGAPMAPQPGVAPLQSAPMPYIPQQAAPGRGGYPAPGGPGGGYPAQPQPQLQPQFNGGPAYDTGARPVVPQRPVPPRQAPAPYAEDPYRRPYPSQGY